MKEHIMKDLNSIKQSVFNSLSSGICQIKFEKVNGEIRNMNCTLSESIIPESQFSISFDDYSQTVYDIEKQAWRSFRWDFLKEVNGINV